MVIETMDKKYKKIHMTNVDLNNKKAGLNCHITITCMLCPIKMDFYMTKHGGT